MNKYINSKNKEKFLNYIKEKRIFLPFVANNNSAKGMFIKIND